MSRCEVLATDGASNYMATLLMYNVRPMNARTALPLNEHCVLEAGGGKGVGDQTIAWWKLDVYQEIAAGHDVENAAR